jgi:hypothetical protein
LRTPVLNIALKVIKKLIHGHENVGQLSTGDMAMITLAALVVVAHTFLSWRPVEQPGLDPVLAGRERLGQFPDDHLDDGSVVADFLGSGQQIRLHVLHVRNTLQTGQGRPSCGA